MRTLFAVFYLECGCSDAIRPATSIRNRLTALKKDRGEFIKPSDVDRLYQAIVKQGQSIPSSHTQSSIQSSGKYDGTLTSAACTLHSYLMTPIRRGILARPHIAFSHSPERSPRRSHYVQQPPRYDPCRCLQSPLPLLPHDRQDARMPRDLQPDCQHEGESLLR